MAARASDPVNRTLLLDAATAGSAIVAVGERGSLFRSMDHARSWSAVPSHVAATLTGVAFANDRVGWAVGHDALILTTTDGGATWSRQWQGANLTDSFLDVLALDQRRAIAIGAYGLYAATSDAGRTWTPRKIIPEDYHLNRITRGPTGSLYIAGEHGTLVRSSDDGASWTPIEAPYDGSFYGVLPLGEKMLLAHGLRGRVYRSMDDGASWIAVPTDAPVLLATAVRLPGGTLCLAGQARALLLSPDAQVFSRQDVGVSTGIAELLILPDGDLLAVGEAGATLIPAARLPASKGNP